MPKNNTTQQREREPAALETEYRALVKINPTSFNDTRLYHKALQKCVNRMRAIRHKGKHDVAFLQEILTREPTK